MANAWNRWAMNKTVNTTSVWIGYTSPLVISKTTKGGCACTVVNLTKNKASKTQTAYFTAMASNSVTSKPNGRGFGLLRLNPNGSMEWERSEMPFVASGTGGICKKEPTPFGMCSNNGIISSTKGLRCLQRFALTDTNSLVRRGVPKSPCNGGKTPWSIGKFPSHAVSKPLISGNCTSILSTQPPGITGFWGV